jgi:hypothetical protein
MYAKPGTNADNVPKSKAITDPIKSTNCALFKKQQLTFYKEA